MKKIVFFLLIFSMFLSAEVLYSKTSKTNKVMREGVCLDVVDAAHIVVSDGLEEIRIKLLGVDSVDKVLFPSTYAKGIEYLKNIIQGKNVVLEYPSGKGQNKEGYFSAFVYHNNALLNKRILEEGHGFYYSRNVPDRHAENLKAGEKEAKKKEKGFWNKRRTSDITPKQMNDFMATQMNSNMKTFMNRGMSQMLPAANKNKTSEKKQ